MDPLQVHKNGKIFLLLDKEIGAVGHIASMAILPAGALDRNLCRTVCQSILERYCYRQNPFVKISIKTDSRPSKTARLFLHQPNIAAGDLHL